MVCAALALEVEAEGEEALGARAVEERAAE
jgi:hypothetical protein